MTMFQETINMGIGTSCFTSIVTY